jgi:hypothetical protein
MAMTGDTIGKCSLNTTEKVIKLLETEQEYEFKDRRTGIYDALREILRSDMQKVNSFIDWFTYSDESIVRKGETKTYAPF